MVKRAKIDHKPKVLQDITDKPAAGIGDNGVSRDTCLFFVGQLKAADKILADARAERKKLRSTMKLQGIDLEILDKVLSLQKQEDTTNLLQQKTLKRYAEFLGMPLGSQMQLFDSPQSGVSFSQEAILKKAYDEGRERGLMGQNPDYQAYPEISPEGQEHTRGWNEGQESLASRIKDLKSIQAAEEKARAAKRAAKNANKADDGDDAE